MHTGTGWESASLRDETGQHQLQGWVLVPPQPVGLTLQLMQGDGLHHPSRTVREGPGPLLISNGYSSGVSRVPYDTQAYTEQKEYT